MSKVYIFAYLYKIGIEMFLFFKIGMYILVIIKNCLN